MRNRAVRAACATVGLTPGGLPERSAPKAPVLQGRPGISLSIALTAAAALPAARSRNPGGQLGDPADRHVQGSDAPEPRRGSRRPAHAGAANLRLARRARPRADSDLSQRYEPGLSDLTHTGALGVTSAGRPFDHMLYHFPPAWSGCVRSAVSGQVTVAATHAGTQGRQLADGQQRSGRVVSRRIFTKVWLTSVRVTPRRVTNSILVLRPWVSGRMLRIRPFFIHLSAYETGR